jgi:hypothetical protein
MDWVVAQFCVNWLNWIVAQTLYGLGSSVVMSELAKLDSFPNSVWIG